MTPELTTAALAELEQAEKEMTPGPWTAGGDWLATAEEMEHGIGNGWLLNLNSTTSTASGFDLDAIAKLRNAAPALLAAARLAHAQAEEIGRLKAQASVRCACIMDGDPILGRFVFVCQAHAERKLRTVQEARNWKAMLTAQAQRVRLLEAVAEAAKEEIAACEAQSQRVMNAEHLEECYDETMLSLGAARELARRKMADALTALDAGKETGK